MRVTQTVEFIVEIPDGTPEDYIDAMTMEIPFEKIRVDTIGGPMTGAKVTAYQTTWVEKAE